MQLSERWLEFVPIWILDTCMEVSLQRKLFVQIIETPISIGNFLVRLITTGHLRTTYLHPVSHNYFPDDTDQNLAEVSIDRRALQLHCNLHQLRRQRNCTCTSTRRERASVLGKLRRMRSRSSLRKALWSLESGAATTRERPGPCLPSTARVSPQLATCSSCPRINAPTCPPPPTRGSSATTFSRLRTL